MTEARARRTADVELGIARKWGKEHLPLKGISRMLGNPDLYRAAAEELLHQGKLTQSEADRILRDAEKIARKVRRGKYRFDPRKGTFFLDQKGRKRPLSRTTNKQDLVVQKVLFEILTAYFDPQFHKRSYAYRKGKGQRQALSFIQRNWTHTRYWIRIDIRQYFPSINHELLLEKLSQNIPDPKFRQLILNWLQAGELHGRQFRPTVRGIPQGADLSCLLANLFLSEFDSFLSNLLLSPASSLNTLRESGQGSEAAEQCTGPVMSDEVNAIAPKANRRPSVTTPWAARKGSVYYVRFADDFLVGLEGQCLDAEFVREAIEAYLWRELRLKTNDKSRIIDPWKESLVFIGYEIDIRPNPKKNGDPSVNLSGPSDKLQARIEKLPSAIKKLADQHQHTPKGLRYLLLTSVLKDHLQWASSYELAKNKKDLLFVAHEALGYMQEEYLRRRQKRLIEEFHRNWEDRIGKAILAAAASHQTGEGVPGGKNAHHRLSGEKRVKS